LSTSGRSALPNSSNPKKTRSEIVVEGVADGDAEDVRVRLLDWISGELGKNRFREAVEANSRPPSTAASTPTHDRPRDRRIHSGHDAAGRRRRCEADQPCSIFFLKIIDDQDQELKEVISA
jgi:hypothetical protein